MAGSAKNRYRGLHDPTGDPGRHGCRNGSSSAGQSIVAKMEQPIPDRARSGLVRDGVERFCAWDGIWSLDIYGGYEIGRCKPHYFSTTADLAVGVTHSQPVSVTFRLWICPPTS